MNVESILRILTLTVLVFVSACASSSETANKADPAKRFTNIETPYDFWMKQIEITGEQHKFDVNDLPTLYHECLAGEITGASTSDVLAAIYKFLKSNSSADYSDLLQKIEKFNRQFEKEKGVEPFAYAAVFCQSFDPVVPPGDTYREVLKNGMAESWALGGSSIDQSPKYVSCVVDETMKTFTTDEVAQLDAVAKNRGNLYHMHEITAARDARLGGGINSLIASKCASAKGT